MGPTFGFTVDGRSSEQVAAELGGAGHRRRLGRLLVVEVAQRLGLGPDDVVRAGIVHYNTADEVDRLLEELTRLHQRLVNDGPESVRTHLHVAALDVERMLEGP